MCEIAEKDCNRSTTSVLISYLVGRALTTIHPWEDPSLFNVLVMRLHFPLLQRLHPRSPRLTRPQSPPLLLQSFAQLVRYIMIFVDDSFCFVGVSFLFIFRCVAHYLLAFIAAVWSASETETSSPIKVCVVKPVWCGVLSE